MALSLEGAAKDSLCEREIVRLFEGRNRSAGGPPMATPRVLLCVAFVLGPQAVAGSPPWGPKPSFEIVAYLQVPKEQRERAKGPREFSAVALRMPWAYALDRDGDLYVFRVPLVPPPKTRPVPSERDNGLIAITGELKGALVEPETTIPGAGDGGHLIVAGDTLLCTRYRRLEVFSLENPARPARVGIAGNSSWLAHASTATVRDETRLFVLSSKRIDLYDIATPRTPNHLGSFSGPRELVCACVAGDKLVVGTARQYRTGDKRNAGLAVFDVSDSARIKETGFIDLGWRAPRQLLRTSGGTLLAPGVRISGLEALSTRTGIGFTPSSDADQPFAATPIDLPNLYHCVMLVKDGRAFLVGPGEVHEVKPPDARLVFTYLPWGLRSVAEGCHGDVEGDYAAIVGGRAIAVLRIKDGK